jgi:hypothetical protein
MQRTLAAVLVLAAFSALLFVLSGGGEAPEAVLKASDSPGTHIASAPVLAAPDARDARGALVAEPEESADAATAAGAATVLAPAVDTTQFARIRGVLLHHDGRPASDARLELEGWTANADREQRYGVPANGWEDVVASPNPDGSFELVFEAPRAFQFSLEVAAPWAVSLDWRWHELLPASVTDLGTVTMPLGGRIEGRVVLPNGTPAPGTWSVTLRDVFESPLRSHGEQLSFAEVAGATQSFVFDGVAPGSVVVELNSAIFPDRTQRVDVVAGRTSDVVFVHDGPPADRRIAVRFLDRITYVFGGPDLAHVHMRDLATGTLVPGTTAETIDRSSIFAVEPGRHVLVVDDPRFEPFESEPVDAGSRLSPKLRGSVSLTLVLTHDGAPVADARFEFERPEGRDPMMPPLIHEVRPSSAAVGGEYTFRTVPDPQVWRVVVDGCAPHTLDLSSGFEPGSTHRIDVRLATARTISGIVVRSSGTPVADVEVVAHEIVAAVPPVDPAAYAEWLNSVQQKPRVRAFTDAAGRFELGPLANDAYDVYTVHDPRVRAWALDVQTSTRDLVLRLEPAGRIEGRVSPAFDGCAGMRVHVGWNEGRERVPPRLAPFGAHIPLFDVDAEGRFAIADAPAGRLELTVRMPGLKLRSNFGSTTSMGRALAPIAVDVAPDATTHVVVDVANEVPLTARIHVNDLRGSGLSLQVVGRRAEAPVDLPRAQASGTVGADGLALVTPIEPGVWSFEVESRDRTWSQPIPGEHVIDPGTTLELSFDIELVRGQVTLVDAGGVPLPNLTLRFLRANGWTSVRSDASGVLDLTLPPGTHRLQPLDAPAPDPFTGRAERCAELVWTSDGPRDAVLVIEGAD